MTSLIALAAIGLFTAGMTAGIIGLVCVAIRREEKSLTLTSVATDPVRQAGRWVNGVYVRAQGTSWYTRSAGGAPDAR